MTKNDMKLMFSTGNDEWETPKELYNQFINNGYRDINPLGCKHDALQIEWYDKTFCNPPYSKSLLKLFVDKAIEESDKGKKIILLIPSRTDTKYFHRLLDHNPIICFVKGRLKFSNKGSAPFPSLLIKLDRKGYSTWYSSLDDFIRLEVKET